MKTGSIMATLLAVTALGIGGVFVAGSMDTASADAEPPQQKIYLDPQTGEVLDTPSADRQEAAAESAEPKAGINDDGDEMRTTSPEFTPATRAVRCDDGTLRMGHADSAPSQDERAALCARSRH